MTNNDDNQNQGTSSAEVKQDQKSQFPIVVVHDDFDSCEEPSLFASTGRNVPCQIFPKIYNDERGGFSESLVSDVREWMMPDCSFLADVPKTTIQVNQSFSSPCVFRGFHAQKAPFCQGKLVECLSETPIFDFIIDCRPQSKSFRKYRMFKLSGTNMSKVWIPRGFLHGFLVPKYEGISGTEVSEYGSQARFQYFCDNSYSKDSEIVIDPKSVLPTILNDFVEEYKAAPEKNLKLVGLLRTIMDDLIYSEKDTNGQDFMDFTESVKKDWEKIGNLWYVAKNVNN